MNTIAVVGTILITGTTTTAITSIALMLKVMMQLLIRCTERIEHRWWKLLLLHRSSENTINESSFRFKRAVCIFSQNFMFSLD